MNNPVHKKRPVVTVERARAFSAAALFTAALFLPALQTLTHLFPEPPFITGQNSREKPPLAKALEPDFPEKFEKDFNQHFGGRQFLVETWSRGKLLAPPGPVNYRPDVLKGKEGWFYYERTFPVPPLPEEKYKRTAANLHKAFEEGRYKDIPLALLVPPDPATIYPEFMPGGFASSKSERIDRLILAMQTFEDSPLVDPRRALMDAKRIMPVYLKTDSHWNDYGAFIAYFEVMNRLARKNPELRPYRIDDFEIRRSELKLNGDMLRMLGVHREVMEETVQIRLKDTAPKKKKADKLLVVGDSYSMRLIQYLKLHFENVVFLIYSKENFGTVMKRERPDAVVLQSLERRLHELLEKDFSSL